MSFNIHDLPVETQLAIFHYIPFVDYFRGLRRVCTLWKDLVDDILSRLNVLNLPNAFNVNKTLTLMGPRLKLLRELNLSRCVSLNDRTFSLILTDSCDALQCVNLSKCHLLTDASVRVIADRHATSIRTLTLDGCTSVSASGLVHLLSKTTGLQTLSLRKLKVPVWHDSMRASFANLERLNLSACPQLIDATLLALATAAPRLVELRIDECRVSAPGVSAAAPALRELRVLSMSYVNSVNDAVLVQVAAHCPLLQTVEAESCTAISSAGVTTLSQLPHLARLNLNCCFLVTDKAINDLHLNCRKLTYLDVKGCQSVTAAAIAQLKSSRPSLQVVS